MKAKDLRPGDRHVEGPIGSTRYIEVISYPVITRDWKVIVAVRYPDGVGERTFDSPDTEVDYVRPERSGS